MGLEPDQLRRNVTKGPVKSHTVFKPHPKAKTELKCSHTGIQNAAKYASASASRERPPTSRTCGVAPPKLAKHQRAATTATLTTAEHPRQTRTHWNS